MSCTKQPTLLGDSVACHPLYNLAMAEALKSNLTWRLGAVIFRGRRKVLAVGHNRDKTHPMSKYFNVYTGKECSWIHAEQSALISCRWYDTVTGSSILVARLLANDKPGMARPCGNCIRILKQYSIKKIFYTTGEQDEIKCEKI
jgi:deoxycytidylate deaminase